MKIYPLRNKHIKCSYSNKDIASIKTLITLLTTKTEYFGRAIEGINGKNFVIQQIVSYWYDYGDNYKSIQPIYKDIDTDIIKIAKLDHNVIYGVLDRIPMLFIDCFRYERYSFIASIPILPKKKNIFYRIKIGSIRRFKINE